jgi:hypothetical protein
VFRGFRGRNAMVVIHRGPVSGFNWTVLYTELDTEMKATVATEREW